MDLSDNRPVLPALVLSAGLGTRLDPLTRLAAKAALPLGECTLIEHVLAWLRGQHVTDVVINLHHRPETIAAVVGDGAHLGLRVRYSWENPVLGSAGGPRHALPLIGNETFLVVNSEPLCDFDVAPMVDAHRFGGADATLAVVPNPAPDVFNGLVVDDEWRIRRFAPRGQADGTWHFIGVQVVQASLFARLEDGVPAETVHGLYRDLIADDPGRLRAWHAPTTSLHHIGTPREYFDAVTALGGTTATGDASGVTSSVVWPGTRIGSDVELDHCIVAGIDEVPAGFRAANALLMPASAFGADDDVEVRDGIAVVPMPPGVTPGRA
jgi:NDP-sugar pyrophosphorylase family protein